MPMVTMSSRLLPTQEAPWSAPAPQPRQTPLGVSANFWGARSLPTGSKLLEPPDCPGTVTDSGQPKCSCAQHHCTFASVHKRSQSSTPRWQSYVVSHPRSRCSQHHARFSAGHVAESPAASPSQAKGAVVGDDVDVVVVVDAA